MVIWIVTRILEIRDSSRIYAELKNAEDSEGKTRLRLQILLVAYETVDIIGREMILGEMSVGDCTFPEKTGGGRHGSRVPYSAMTPLTFTASLILTYFVKFRFDSFRMLRFR